MIRAYVSPRKLGQLLGQQVEGTGEVGEEVFFTLVYTTYDADC